MRTSIGISLAATLLFLVLPACNGGLFAVAASSADDTPSSDSPTTMSGFTVEDDKAGKATIRFLLSDADGDSAEVTLYYQTQGGTKQLVTALATGANPDVC